MHVDHFIHRYPPAIGGSEAWFARLSQALVEQGDSVTVWTTTAIDLAAFRESGRLETSPGTSIESGVRVRRFRPDGRFPGRRYFLKLASFVPNRLWQAHLIPPLSRSLRHDVRLDEAPCDLVHATAFPYGHHLAAAWKYSQRKQAPFFLTPFLHLGNPDQPKDRLRRAYTSPCMQWFLKRADRIFVQTESELRAVRDFGVRSERIILQGLGVDTSECTGGDRLRWRARLGVRTDEVVVGHLANQSYEKGTIDLVRALDVAHRSDSRLRLVLAGPMMASFEKFQTQFGQPSWLVQLGSLTDDERRDFYAGIDCFCLPSRSDSFGLVFLEAWANAKPVIGYRAGGVADLIRHDRDGLLVRCGAIEELAQALISVTDADYRTRLGQAGFDRIPVEFQWADKIEIVRRAMHQQ